MSSLAAKEARFEDAIARAVTELGQAHKSFVSFAIAQAGDDTDKKKKAEEQSQEATLLLDKATMFLNCSDASRVHLASHVS